MMQYWIQVKQANWEVWVSQDNLHGNAAALIAFWEREQRVYSGDDAPKDPPIGAPMIILTKDATDGQDLPHACGQLGIANGLLPADGIIRVIIHGSEIAMENKNRYLLKALAASEDPAVEIVFIKQSNTEAWLNRIPYSRPEKTEYAGACVAKYLLKGPDPLADRVKRAVEWMEPLEDCWDTYAP